MPDAVIFDCDGVLVNSEEIYRQVETAYLAEIGLVYDPNDYADRFLGVTIEAYVAGLDADYRRQHGRSLPDGFVDRMLALTWSEIEKSVAAHDGVHDVVAALSVTKAVASSSGKMRLDHKLRRVGIYDAFAPHVYSAEAVGRGKPAPDLYLHTAAELSVAPKSCIAIEDSVNGVLSARGAGMIAIGYVGGRHCPPQQSAKLRAAGAVVVIDHMNQLLGVIAEIG